MKVLLIHNYYKQRGGEDESFDAECKLLRDYGHQVEQYTRNNNEIDGLSRAKVAIDTFWNSRSHREVKALIRQFQPDIVHCTNLFPLISTSVYDAANQCGVPVVQALRNYRHMCVNSFFYLKGKICSSCKTKRFAWPGIVNRCYRGSRSGSAVVAAHNVYHRMRKTWDKRVSAFFAPTEFARQQYIDAGFPAEKIFVKPNFLSPDPGFAKGKRSFALFVGRLSPEKGLKTLVQAWSQLEFGMELRIVGSGFLEKFAAELSAKTDNIIYEGALPLEQVKELAGQARFLVMPSEWYETFGRTIMEAYSRGTPVIASRLGAMAEIVQDGYTGISYKPGDANELAQAMESLFNNEALRAELGRNARKTFEHKYTDKVNHSLMIDIYQAATQWAQHNPSS